MIPQDCPGQVAHEVGRVVVFAEVNEHDGAQSFVQERAQERAHVLVREVADAAADALLHLRRIIARQQPPGAVVGFQHDGMGTGQAAPDHVRDVAEVRGKAELGPVAAHNVVYGVARVVRDAETGYLEVADGNRVARLEYLDCARGGDSGRQAGAGLFREEYRRAEAAGQDAQPRHMVAVFVSDEYCVQPLQGFPHCGRPCLQLAQAEPAVDQHLGLVRNDERRVAAAATAEKTEPEHREGPSDAQNNPPITEYSTASRGVIN